MERKRFSCGHCESTPASHGAKGGGRKTHAQTFLAAIGAVGRLDGAYHLIVGISQLGRGRRVVELGRHGRTPSVGGYPGWKDVASGRADRADGWSLLSYAVLDGALLLA